MGDQTPQEDGSAEGGTPHKNTNTGTPHPDANARDAQLPEPKPEKHADAEADGNSPTGQGADTNPTNACGVADAATAPTNAEERRANANRPRPNSDARKTCACSAAARTNASAPAAQPTATAVPDTATPEATAETNGANSADKDREPQKPTIPKNRKLCRRPPTHGAGKTPKPADHKSRTGLQSRKSAKTKTRQPLAAAAVYSADDGGDSRASDGRREGNCSHANAKRLTLRTTRHRTEA